MNSGHPIPIRATGIIIIIVSLLIGACGSDEANDDAALSVEGTEWVLDELAGTPVPDGVEVTLEFDGTRVAGSGGCNQYSSDATFDNETVSFAGEIMSTAMACDEPASSIEASYLEALPRVTGFVVEGDVLTLSDSDDQTILVFKTTT